MNKKIFFILITMLTVLTVFSSCMMGKSSAESMLVGVWENIGSGYSYTDINFQFNSDGTAKMIGADVYSDGEAAELSWAADGYHLEINDLFLMYSALYVYEISADGNTLDLYQVAEGLFNMTYESSGPGEHMTLVKTSSSLSSLGDDSLYY